MGAKDDSGEASGEAEREDESSGSENGEHHCRRHLRKIDMIDGIAVLEVKKNGSTGSYLTMFHGATETEWIFQVRFSLHRLPASIFFLCRCHCELPLCRGNVSQCLKRLTSPLCAEKPGCYGYCYKCCVLNEIGNICSFHQLHFSLLPFRICDSILAAGRD